MIDHTANCLMHSLDAARHISNAMMLFDRRHAGQIELLKALHNALIVAEECRQAWGARRQERPEGEHG